MGTTLTGALLIGRAWRVNSGALEIERWSKTYVSSKTALVYLVLVTYSWLGLVLIEKLVTRKWLKGVCFVIHFGVIIGIANLLAYVSTPIQL